jgi:hypothetical protein
MSSFFDSMQRSFEDVQVTDKEINTVQFLEASESLVAMFGKPPFFYALISLLDLLESTAFAVMKNDMNGNIKVD